MKDDRDPMLQHLFDAAREEAPSDIFLTTLMQEVARGRRRSVIRWSCIGIIFAILAWLATPVLVDAVDLMTQVLPRSLIHVEDDFFAQLLAPVNSIAMLVAAGLLGALYLYRKVFH
jgi:NADH:ubiquinone oxidoreductase subunit 6 (subunit J)